jgi:F-type H+-transporting ATPase subunit gamma
MKHLIKIRQQIKSIQTTKKVTHAIRLTSMSLYSNLEKQNNFLQSYTSKITELFSDLITSNPHWQNPSLAPGQKQNDPPMAILISSTKGLCGSINTLLFKYFENNFDPDKQTNIIAVGQKAVNFAEEISKTSKAKLILKYSDINHNNYSSLADDIVKKIIMGQVKASSINIYYNYSKSLFTQIQKKTALIPIQKDSGIKPTTKKRGSFFDTIFEQDKHETIDFIATKYIKSRLMCSIFQALISEHAARFIAMDNATTNSQNLLESLNLEHNKLRQNTITREVSELSRSIQAS